ncbi:endo-1,3(4)-beta-glucanase [Achlya hypogyna]|uniref:glucan endo-1,3-beta-D-glucosidase n=1 Tax=Achlya hypogyna TaxID=1202772 RepID=A0A0A7CNE3_ACHHY|nr:secreted protein [Achlya hypogyna]OQR90178.1 endo-1,3(4)-beta-glucanase [Achlya hypogyna]
MVRAWTLLALLLPLAAATNTTSGGLGTPVHLQNTSTSDYADESDSSSGQASGSSEHAFSAAFRNGSDYVDSLYKKSNDQSWFAPPRNLASSVKDVPIPTNRWWGNLIAAGKDNAELRAWVNPFAIAMHANAIGISYPPQSRVFGGTSGNGKAPRYYLHGIGNDVFVSAKEISQSGATPFQIAKWDDLGVTIAASAGGKSIESYLVSGMAYVTAKYVGLTPRLTTTHGITKVNGKAVGAGASFPSTSKLSLTFDNGMVWIVYASTPVTWTLSTSTELVAASGLTGTVRLAMAAKGGDGAEYDAYADCIVRGGSVKPSTSSYSFEWATEGACSRGLLHFGLQHHIDTLIPATARRLNGSSLALESTTRGKLFALVSRGPWTFHEKSLVPATFLPRTSLSKARLQSSNLLKVLTDDIQAPWNMPVGGSYYFNGKAAQKYASLCLMASDPAVVGSDTTLLKTCQRKLETVLTPFVTNGWTYPLVYDTLYRGIVSSEGFVKKDLNADFGNTMYNDHHYHYGYWIAAAAITNKVHQTWAKLQDLNARVATLVRDVANADASDSLFPTFRMFDWYKGHSYSHGVTAMADGKDQESSSEDINFHYGMTLYGQVTKNSAMAELGQLMLTLNARAVQTYFLMADNNVVQPAEMIPNKVLGIFFDNKADYATWFSPEKYCIHGIQMIPTTPVTEFVRTKTFVKEEWDQILSKLPLIKNAQTDNAWASLLYLNYATVNPDAAVTMLAKVAMDDGLARSWALYIAASQ